MRPSDTRSPRGGNTVHLERSARPVDFERRTPIVGWHSAELYVTRDELVQRRRRGHNSDPPVKSALDSLQGRVALVTGGSGGIGSSIVTRLAEDGAAVAIGYHGNAKRANALSEGILAKGGRAVVLGADLRLPDAAKLIDMVETALGPVDILVCNAGLGKAEPLEQVTVDDFNQTIAVNLRAPFLLAQRALPGMQRRGFGRVLFISSVAAFTGGLVGPHYAASKAGLNGLAHFLAQRAAGFGVTVNALAPSLIAETGMLPAKPQDLSKLVPVGRLGRPQEVADLALAILRNPYLTNQVISLDGGIYPR